MFLEQLLVFSIRHRFAVLVGTLALVAFGIHAFETLPIDAVPDVTNVQVQVLTATPSLGTLDVERLVTTPVEQAMAGIPRVEQIRSLSRYGVSAVTVVFHDDVALERARQLVNERLPRARDAIPATYGVPELGPASTGLGEIYQFEVRGDGLTPMELRSILDWQIAPRLRLVPGVVEVNTFGGELKTYEVAMDPRRMIASHVSVADLIAAIERNNRATGGGAIVRGPEALLFRGDGLVSSLEDLRGIVVGSPGGVPVYVRQVADVRFAPMLRQGAATRDGRGEVVTAMAMMLAGENSRAVARAVDAAVQRINTTLPRGVRIETFYDRTTLVEKTIHTVTRSLLEGGALVVIVLLLMLRNLRAGLVAAAMIPLCMLAAFIGMRLVGASGNLVSLGAIDFGLVVDGAIILVENAVHHLSEACARLGRPLTRPERDEIVLRSAVEVRTATAFGEVIIALVYVPVLALEGVEGKMFRPMAFTVLSALAGAFVLSLTFVPALASLVLPAATRDAPSPVVTFVRRIYAPVLARTFAHPWVTLALAVCALAGGALVARTLGSEFVPRLEEGSIVIETTRLPSVSLEQSVRECGAIERALLRFPEVATVVSKTGRPEIANDPMGIEQSDIFVLLRPREQWPGSRDREALVHRMDEALRSAAPGIAFGFSQPIQMRTNELLSGTRSDVAIEVYGDDLPTLARLGARIARVVSRVPGAADVRADRVEGLPVLRASVDRAAVALRGASADDVLQVVESVGGVTVGTVIEGRRRVPLRVRVSPELRSDLDAVRHLPVRAGEHGDVPLDALAHLVTEDEPVVVSHEALERRLVVQVNVRGRDLGGFAGEAQRAVSRAVALPAGYHLAWGGEFENLRRARVRLAVVVPIALLVILALLYATFDSLPPALLIFADVPFAAIGGVLALAVRRMPFSISAAVGFIALSGVAVLNGLVLVSHVRSLRAAGHDLDHATSEGALRRLRPVLTTALVASLGFVPMALATGEGAEVQRPLATVVIGGLISSTVLTLLVLPTVYRLVAGRSFRRRDNG